MTENQFANQADAENSYSASMSALQRKIDQLATAEKVIEAARDAHNAHEYASAVAEGHSSKFAAKTRFYLALKKLHAALAEYDKLKG